MDVADETPNRAYNSPLRDDRARRTREAIVAALVEQVADAGLNDFSVPKVAKRAGVSVRTVYRYFPNRDDLLDAVNEYWSPSMERVDGAHHRQPRRG
jgi:AcrR family transcriptional regulator